MVGAVDRVDDTQRVKAAKLLKHYTQDTEIREFLVDGGNLESLIGLMMDTGTNLCPTRAPTACFEKRFGPG